MIKQFDNPLYKGFHDRSKALAWLRDQHAAVNFAESIPEMSTTPVSKPIRVVQNAQHVHVDPDPVVEIPVVKAYPIPTASAVAVPVKRKRDFSPLVEMASLIASMSVVQIPKAPVCKCPTCPYMSGEIFCIRRALLLRLQQTGLITAEHNY